MGKKSNKGLEYDQSKIDKVLSLVIDCSDYELSVLIEILLKEKNKRGNRNIDIIQV